MNRALIGMLAVGLASLAQAQSNLYHPSKSSIKELMKKAAAQKAAKPNTTVDFAKPAKNHRDNDFGVYRRREKPCAFDTLIPVPADTNYALHGASYAVGYGWPVQYEDASASPTQGVLIVNNCSAHANVAHVNLLTIQYGCRRNCDKRLTRDFSLKP